MNITSEMNMHNCQLCKKEWLGRCYGKLRGKDVSMENKPCSDYEFGGTQERLNQIEQQREYMEMQAMYEANELEV